MHYVTSLLASLLAHGLILGMIVAVPMIFCNVINVDGIIGTVFAPQQPLTQPIDKPLAPGGSGGGGGSKPTAAKAELREPIKIPDTINDTTLPEVPPDDLISDGLGLGPGPGGSGSGCCGGNGIGFGPAGISTLARPLDFQPIAPEKRVAPPPPQKTAVVHQAPVPVPSTVQESKLVYKVIPAYPEVAIRSHISGNVQLVAIIDEEGKVTSLRVVKGHLFLKDAAYQAVKQWRYSPTILSGEPVQVEASIIVSFILNN